MSDCTYTISIKYCVNHTQSVRVNNWTLCNEKKKEIKCVCNSYWTMFPTKIAHPQINYTVWQLHIHHYKPFFFFQFFSFIFQQNATQLCATTTMPLNKQLHLVYFNGYRFVVFVFTWRKKKCALNASNGLFVSCNCFTCQTFFLSIKKNTGLLWYTRCDY